MRKTPVLFVSLLIFSLITSTFTQPTALAQLNLNAAQPPVAERAPHKTDIHGETLIDNYFWLRERNSPKVKAYLEAENAYTDAVMQPTKPLQERLYQEMVGHIKETDLSVPYKYGDYFYYSRTEAGKQYQIYCRKRGSLSAPEEITLDLNELAKGHSFLGLGDYAVSDDGNLLACSLDTTGYRQYTLYIKNLQTGQLMPEHIERVDSVAWANDNKTIFYTTEDAVTKRNDKFYRHTVGSSASDLLYEERDELYDVYAGRSRDRKMIFLESGSKTTTEVRYIPADNPTAQLKVVLPRETDHEYHVDHRNGLFYILTNQSAKNFRLVTAPISNPSKQNWHELIAHNPAVRIDDIELFANHMVVAEREGGLQKLLIMDLRNKKSHRISFDEPVYSANVSTNREYNTNVLRFSYESFVTPNTVYDYNMDSRQRTKLKQQEVPGYDPTRYTSERVYATATDGTQIPISLVYKKGMQRNGQNPFWLYGYGSYGLPRWPGFSSNRLSLLDRGVIYAIAHIRGGGEMGEVWRDLGRMNKKMNTFTDFINSAEYVIKQKYTSPEHLAIQGGSAGGLLMGAVLNMRPDLFKAALVQVPFVDVINTMLDASLPLTTSEYIEWGNPNIKAEYEYIKQYSPYDNVGAKAYPAMLVKVSLNDSQVPYWEGTKFVAKLRAMKTDHNPLLLKVNMGAGHGGASGRYDAFRDVAFDYSFVLTQLGIT